MKTVGGGRKALRTAVYAVLRHAPRLRIATRHAYWAFQRRKYHALAASVPTEPLTVFFEAYGGRSYACSPKAIYREMIADSRFAGREFIWSFRGDSVPDDEPELDRACIVRRGSQEYFRALARAGVIVMNNRLPEYVHPKQDQVYVQCWHGTPLKRLGYDVQIDMQGALNTASELAQRFGLDARKWTYLLSPSPYTSQHLADAFGLPENKRANTILELGYPRNDALAQARDDARARDRAASALGVPAGKKTLLYAPTWRDDSYRDGVGYTFDYLLDFDAMQRALGDEWVVLFRAHYYIANSFDFSSYDGFVIDVSGVDDINDVYLASDLLLNDYSSVMFDYANLRRPMALFVPDFDHYAANIRGFYFDLADVPGPQCTTTAQVIEAISDFDHLKQRYSQSYDEFVARFCPLDDGCAAKRVVERVAEDQRFRRE